MEGKRADIEDLVVGMTVKFEILNDGTVGKVNAQLEKAEGVVVSLDADNMHITLRLYDTNVTYELDEDVRAEADGQRIRLGSIRRGDRVVLEFQGGLVVLIKAN